jgi:hypothetical protein
MSIALTSLARLTNLRGGMNAPKTDPLHGARLKAAAKGIKMNCFQLHTVSIKTVRKSLKRAKFFDAKDTNGISPLMLKYCGILGSLTHAINATIKEGIVPERWKIAQAVPVHKKKSRSDVKNFCLVAILNCCSKIMEEIVQQQFETHFKGMKLIPEEQHGFRPSRSMSSAAHVAVHDIRRLRVDGKCVVSL